MNIKSQIIFITINLITVTKYNNAFDDVTYSRPDLRKIGFLKGTSFMNSWS